jgi:hypothetical protein
MELLDVPHEVLVQVVCLLGWNDVVSTRQACRALFEASTSETAYHALCCRYFPHNDVACNNGDWRTLFLRLAFHTALDVARFPRLHMFVKLDVRFHALRDLVVRMLLVLVERPQCISAFAPVCNAIGKAEWGQFEFACVSYGTYFAGFSFYSYQSLSSVYVGRLRNQREVIGTLFTSYQELEGTMVIQQEDGFESGAGMGPELIDFHQRRALETEAAFPKLDGGMLKIALSVDEALFDQLGTDDSLTIQVLFQSKGSLRGLATFCTKEFTARGVLLPDGQLALLLDCAEENLEHERMLLLGEVLQSSTGGLRFKVRALRVMRKHSSTNTMRFQGRYSLFLRQRVFQAGSFSGHLTAVE